MNGRSQDTLLLVSEPKNDQEPQWISDAAKGNIDAFGNLVEKYEQSVRGYLRSRLRDWASADDLAQDVFVTAFKGVSKFRGESSFETWLRGIALNHLRNFIRKKREEYVGGEGELQLLMEESVDAWEAKMGGSSKVDALRECLLKMDVSSVTLLEDRYTKGLTVREIAKESGKGYSALTMKLHRLRETLAKCIEQRMERGSA